MAMNGNKERTFRGSGFLSSAPSRSQSSGMPNRNPSQGPPPGARPNPNWTQQINQGAGGPNLQTSYGPVGDKMPRPGQFPQNAKPLIQYYPPGQAPDWLNNGQTLQNSFNPQNGGWSGPLRLKGDPDPGMQLNGGGSFDENQSVQGAASNAANAMIDNQRTITRSPGIGLDGRRIGGNQSGPGMPDQMQRQMQDAYGQAQQGRGPVDWNQMQKNLGGAAGAGFDAPQGGTVFENGGQFRDPHGGDMNPNGWVNGQKQKAFDGRNPPTAGGRGTLNGDRMNRGGGSVMSQANQAAGGQNAGGARGTHEGDRMSARQQHAIKTQQLKERHKAEAENRKRR